MLAQEQGAEHRREHDKETGDEAGVGRARVLKRERLRQIAAGEEDAHHEAGPPALAGEAAQLAPEQQGHEQPRGRESVAEEREHGQALHGVLHHHERQAPHGGDPDERHLRGVTAAHAWPDRRRALPYGHRLSSGHSPQRGSRAVQVRRPWRISPT